MAANDTAPETREIQWRGRTWSVVQPTPEQLTVIYRMSKLPPQQDASVMRQLATMNRTPSLLESLLALESDWIDVEDWLTTRKVTITELIEPITEAMIAWGKPADGRAGRRAAAKKTTARRVAS